MAESAPFTAHVLTLFPEMFPGVLGQSLHGMALEKGLWTLNVINIRDFATDKHATVDDTPYGGGAGMVMKPDVLGMAIDALPESVEKIFYLSPRGEVLTQKKCGQLSAMGEVAFICGRYEGIDQRVLDHYGIEELSIGDYVLSGGEVAAKVVLEATVRLIPGVLGSADTLSEESHSNGLLEYPHYTKPQKWAGQSVPDVLLSGHHGQIEAWRQRMSEELTRNRRPDLYEAYHQKSGEVHRQKGGGRSTITNKKTKEQ